MFFPKKRVKNLHVWEKLYTFAPGFNEIRKMNCLFNIWWWQCSRSKTSRD